MKVALGCGAIVVLLMLGGIIYAFVAPKAQQSPDTANTANTVELAEACSKGYIELQAHGTRSIDSFEVSITSKSSKYLVIKILPGMVFTSTWPATQSMIVVAEKLISLSPKDSVDSVVEAACINMHLSAPWSSDELVFSGATTNEDLLKLVQFPAFQTLGFSLKQFAIWTITDNPPSADDYMGISSGFNPFGTGPSQANMDTIRGLFQSAGIDTAKYYALSGSSA